MNANQMNVCSLLIVQIICGTFNQGFKISILPCHFCQLPLLIILLCKALQCIQKQINLTDHVTKNMLTKDGSISTTAFTILSLFQHFTVTAY